MFSAAFLVSPRLLLSERSIQISPGTTRFFPSICLPHLLPMIPCSYWASACTAVLPSCSTLYVVSVRQARGLPVVSLFPHPASFGFHLAMDTLAFGYILPTTGRIRDFHPLETCAARRTHTKIRADCTPARIFTCIIYFLPTTKYISSVEIFFSTVT